MTKTEAFIRRVFYLTVNYYGIDKMEIGDVYIILNNGKKLVYVGKNKLCVL